MIVAALGEPALLDGFGLAGAVVHAAETADDVRREWAALAGHAAVVLLTPRAAASLGDLADQRGPLTVVLPG